MAFTPPLFLLLTVAIPRAAPAVIPAGLIALFLVGSAMRTWTMRRLT
ncbi:MAG: hypothetical protein ABI376_09075 [Caulobacteraceae bacterium]